MCADVPKVARKKTERERIIVCQLLKPYLLNNILKKILIFTMSNAACDGDHKHTIVIGVGNPR